MSVPMSQQMREQLTFEQKARYDELLLRRQKKEGTATVLSLPLLGTFGLEHFYLGNTVRGVLSLVFSWTLIPTIIALFDLLTGDIKRQVAFANERIARQVYQNVIDNTPKPEDIPAAAATVVAPPAPPTPAATPTPIEPQADVTTSTVTETLAFGTLPTAIPANEATPAAPVANDAVIAATDALPDAAPATVTESAMVADTLEQDATTTTSGTFTQTQSSAAWQQGMDAPATTSDSTTTTYGDVAATEPVITSTVVEEDAPAAAIAAPVAPATDDDALAPGDGVLVFLADDDEPTDVAPVNGEVDSITATEIDTTTQTVYQETVAQQEHVATQQYQDGKLVSATRSDNTLTGEINTLLTEHSTEDIIAEMDARTGGPAPSAWVDVSPLHPGDAPATDAGNTAAAPTDAAPATSDAPPPTPAPTGTDATGGGMGSGGGNTDVPGGELGPSGGNAPGGGLGN